MLDDLENAIDGLESDDEEEKQPPVRKIFVLLILINCHEIAQEAIACEEGR